jgi:hypothetical protein
VYIMCKTDKVATRVREILFEASIAYVSSDPPGHDAFITVRPLDKLDPLTRETIDRVPGVTIRA